jgi:hypothetical protein
MYNKLNKIYCYDLFKQLYKRYYNFFTPITNYFKYKMIIICLLNIVLYFEFSCNQVIRKQLTKPNKNK